MDIYNTDGALDFEKANRELKASGFVTNKEARNASIASLQTAALLDIADSLRTLAVEAALSMGRNGAFDGLDDLVTGPDPEPSSLAVLDVVEGMRVHWIDDDGVVGTTTGEGGVSEGEAWAGVHWDGDESASRVYARHLVLIEPQTIAELADSAVPLVGVATADEAPALREDGDEDGEPAVGGYDLDEPVRLPVEELNDDVYDADTPPAELLEEDDPHGYPAEESQYDKAMRERGETVPDEDFDDAAVDAVKRLEEHDAVAALKARQKASKKGGKK